MTYETIQKNIDNTATKIRFAIDKVKKYRLEDKLAEVVSIELEIKDILMDFESKISQSERQKCVKAADAVVSNYNLSKPFNEQSHELYDLIVELLDNK